MSKIFVVIFPYQEAQITAWCWGSCGHGAIGALNLGPSMAVPCRHSPCPHLDRESEESIGEVDGEAVHVRKLKPVTP